MKKIGPCLWAKLNYLKLLLIVELSGHNEHRDESERWNENFSFNFR